MNTYQIALITILVLTAAILLMIYQINLELNSFKTEIANLKTNQNKIIELINNLNSSLKTPKSNDPILVNLSKLVKNPEKYQGKLIAVIGELHMIASIPEVRYPFNAILTDKSSQIGVEISNSIPYKGVKVMVIGWLNQGTIEKLGKNGWTPSGKTWYIIAAEIHKI